MYKNGETFVRSFVRLLFQIRSNRNDTISLGRPKGSTKQGGRGGLGAGRGGGCVCCSVGS